MLAHHADIVFIILNALPLVYSEVFSLRLKTQNKDLFFWDRMASPGLQCSCCLSEDCSVEPMVEARCFVFLKYPSTRGQGLCSPPAFSHSRGSCGEGQLNSPCSLFNIPLRRVLSGQSNRRSLQSRRATASKTEATSARASQWLFLCLIPLSRSIFHPPSPRLRQLTHVLSLPLITPISQSRLLSVNFFPHRMFSHFTQRPVSVFSWRFISLSSCC